MSGTKWRAGLLAALGLLWAPPAAAAPPVETKTVLVLFSNSRLLPANVEAERSLRARLANTLDRRIGREKAVRIFFGSMPIPKI